MVNFLSDPELAKRQFIAKVLHVFPDLKKVQATYSDKEKIRPILFPHRPNMPPAELTDEMQIARNRFISNTLSALQKIERFGLDAHLTKQEVDFVTCSLILTVRPAILFQNDVYDNPPGPSLISPLDWKTILEPHRNEIQETAKSVGRIEYQQADGKEWSEATGFLVADNVIMTAGHVAEAFCESNDDGDKWTFKTTCANEHIDYCAEYKTTMDREFKIKKVLKMHYDDDLDIALLKVNKRTSHNRVHPTPLVLADTLPDPVESTNGVEEENRRVYAVGYPTFDTMKETRGDLEKVLGKEAETYGFKRLQPGEFRNTENGLIEHDCSTVSGNSGCCIVDLKLSRVIGLHFHGKDGDNVNHAIALPLLTQSIKDEFKGYGIKFA
jgi:V8-like Glu-specific endopeptidase